MAKGDLKVKLINIGIQPGESVEAMFQLRVEPKAGIKSPKDTVSARIPWDEFWASLTAEQKTALNEINSKIMAYGKANVEQLEDAIEE